MAGYGVRACGVCGVVKRFRNDYGACSKECTLKLRRGEVGVDPVQAADMADRRRVERERTKAAIQEAVRRSRLHAFVDAILQAGEPEPPRWTVKLPKGGKEVTPTIFLSDQHFGEVVDPAKIEDLNEYNRAIAERRLKAFFENSVRLARDYIARSNYPGIVLAMGGDSFSGDIHEELARTNEGEIQDEILHWLEPMMAGIRLLADEFGRVFIPAVVGNHARGTKKPTNKMRVENNFDWLFVELLRRFLRDDRRISWHISRSADCDYRIYGTRYRLTHGDQFRGGSGIAGLLSPLMIGDARKRSRAQQAGRTYDYLMMGHWHQLAMFRNIIVNGSLKGYDEYAYHANFQFEEPRQWFWLTHPQHGLTITAPVHVEEPRRRGGDFVSAV